MLSDSTGSAGAADVFNMQHLSKTRAALCNCIVRIQEVEYLLHSVGCNN